ncbi:hypothetical protein KDD30_07755 [Photobacterium sp. GJ3]|uniref:phage tail protein n=1 Tax=Photobacterium sp. GJ3 TaxID=2829502 RepID=UPI001B8BF263|nr:hypothetical protein [Photobacterium sp. GJ3]QUJ68951.1 hypothetical protein KDD30_07755 [Photobacterium sp. GJ3]
MASKFFIFIFFVLNANMLLAQQISPEFCNAVLDQGISNREQVISDRDKFIQLQSEICSEKFNSYSEMSDSAGKIGLSIPLGSMLLGLNAEAKQDNNVFKLYRDKFCSSRFSDFRQKEYFSSVKTMIDQRLLTSWNTCIRDMLNKRIEDSGVYAFAELQPSFDNFFIFVRYYKRVGDPKSLEIKSILPSSVKCTYNNKPLPIKITSDKFVLDCHKEASESVSVNLNTTLGYTRPSMKLPGKIIKEITMDGLNARLDDLEELLSSYPKIPSGAVMAFDLEKCPTGWGWHPFRGAQGRFILGIGNNNESNKDQNGQVLTNWKLGNNGGEENHKLTVSEMPAHSHAGYRVPWGRLDWDGGPSADFWARNGGKYQKYQTSVVGGNNSHNNMPPFIALLYCVKQ